MRTTTAPAEYTALAFARVVAAFPDVATVLTAIQDTSPQALWLIHQGRAIDHARTMLDGLGDNAPMGFARHTAAALHPTPLGEFRDAVQHALGAQTGGSVRMIDLDTASAVVLYAVGRHGVDPDVYRRAVAPLVQTGAEVPYHPAERPDGTPSGKQWERGCAFRSGYRDASHGDPVDVERVQRMHPRYLEAYAAGHAAAKVDQAP